MDLADPELLEGPPDLGREAGPGQLLLEGQALRGPLREDPVAVDVQGQRQPHVGADRAQHGRLLAAASVPRTRDRGGRSATYDLRPLLTDVAVVTGISSVGPPDLRMRTRFDPQRGVGRPEEVVAALTELVGRPLQVDGIRRDRLLTADGVATPKPMGSD